MGVSQQQQQQTQQQREQQQQQPEVHANELEWGPDGRSTGGLQCEVQCGRDKLAALQQMVTKHTAAAAAGAAAAGGGGAVVYVGDSASDILPLLEV